MRWTNVAVSCALALATMLACGCSSGYRGAVGHSAHNADADSLAASGRRGGEIAPPNRLEGYRGQVFAVTARAGLHACEILAREDASAEEEHAAVGCLLHVYSVLAALDSQTYYQLFLRTATPPRGASADTPGYCWSALIQQYEHDIQGERLLLAWVRVAQTACRKALLGEEGPREVALARDIFKELVERVDPEGNR